MVIDNLILVNIITTGYLISSCIFYLFFSIAATILNVNNLLLVPS